MTFSRRSAAALVLGAAALPLSAGAQSANMPLPSGPRDMLDRLTTEHRAILGYVHQLIQSGDFRERGRLVAELIDTLTIHDADEENNVYPALRTAAHRGGDADRLYREQDEAKVALASLALVSPRDAQFVPMLQRLATSLAGHFDREEHDAFPLVRHAAGAHYARLNALSDRMRSHWNYAPV